MFSVHREYSRVCTARGPQALYYSGSIGSENRLCRASGLKGPSRVNRVYGVWRSKALRIKANFLGSLSFNRTRHGFLIIGGTLRSL